MTREALGRVRVRRGDSRRLGRRPCRAVVASMLAWTLVVLGPQVGAGQTIAPDVAKAPRVTAARAARGEGVRRLFADHGVPYPAQSLFFRAFKRDAVLEMWAGASSTGRHTLITELPDLRGFRCV